MHRRLHRPLPLKALQPCLNLPPTMPRFLTAALYKFVELPAFATLQAPLLACCEANAVKGTLLLASEGINGTIAGLEAGVHAVLAHLRQDLRLVLCPTSSLLTSPLLDLLVIRTQGRLGSRHELRMNGAYIDE